MVEKILTRLKFPKKQIEEIVACVEHHMQFKDVKQMRKATLRRMLLRETFPLELELHRLDCLGSHGALDHYEFLVAQAAELDKQPTIRPPLLTGDDLIALGVKPGKVMGTLLAEIRELQHNGFDMIPRADRDICVPFADGVFIRFTAQCDWRICILAQRQMFLAFRTGHDEQIALPSGLALVLDAPGPDFVRRLNINEHAGVVGLRCHFQKAPFDGENVIAIIFCGADVPGRFAGAMNEAVGDGPGHQWVGMIIHAKGPTIKIPAVEKLDAMSRRDHFLRGAFCQRENEAKYNGGGFHGREDCRHAAASQARGGSNFCTRSKTSAGERARRHSSGFSKWQVDFMQGEQGRSRRNTFSSWP